MSPWLIQPPTAETHSIMEIVSECRQIVGIALVVKLMKDKRESFATPEGRTQAARQLKDAIKNQLELPEATIKMLDEWAMNGLPEATIKMPMAESERAPGGQSRCTTCELPEATIKMIDV